jgi:hypothetical protein
MYHIDLHYTAIGIPTATTAPRARAASMPTHMPGEVHPPERQRERDEHPHAAAEHAAPAGRLWAVPPCREHRARMFLVFDGDAN